MRHQAGADVVELNARDGFARYLLHEPQQLDFEAIEEAAHDAGYTLTKLTLVVRARAVKAEDGTGTALRVAPTDQTIALRGSLPDATTMRVKGTISGWKGGQPVFDLVESSVLP